MRPATLLLADDDYYLLDDLYCYHLNLGKVTDWTFNASILDTEDRRRPFRCLSPRFLSINDQLPGDVTFANHVVSF